jgi:hypothetical protein
MTGLFGKWGRKKRLKWSAVLLVTALRITNVDFMLTSISLISSYPYGEQG